MKRKHKNKGDRIPNWKQYNRRMKSVHDTQNPSPDEDTKIRVKTAKELNL